MTSVSVTHGKVMKYAVNSCWYHLHGISHAQIRDQGNLLYGFFILL